MLAILCSGEPELLSSILGDCNHCEDENGGDEDDDDDDYDWDDDGDGDGVSTCGKGNPGF